jgi:hypothetical protein
MDTDRVDCTGDSEYYEIITSMVYANLAIFTTSLLCNLDKENKASLAYFREEVI